MIRMFQGEVVSESWGNAVNGLHLHIPIEYKDLVTVIISRVGDWKDIPYPYNRDYERQAKFLITVHVDAEPDALASGWTTVYGQFTEIPKR